MSQDGVRVPQEVLERLPPEAQVLVAALLAEVERLSAENAELRARLAALEARLGRNPRNSSVPPSAEHPHQRPAAQPKKRGRRRGGQRGHRKHERALAPVGDCAEVVPLWPKSCRRCGGHLADAGLEPLRHQVWELPEVRPLVTEYRRHRLLCPGCGVTTAAPLPAGVPTGQSGPRLVAFTALLMAYFRQSRRRTALFLEALLGTPCSTGLTVKHQEIASAALAGCHAELLAALPASDVANVDETAAMEAGRKAWLWTAATAAFTVFAVRLTRAGCVVRELLGEAYAGVVVSDRYAGYDHCLRRQICWAHLVRDFRAMAEAGGRAGTVGERLREAAEELFGHWHRARDGTIQGWTLRRRLGRLRTRVRELLEEGLRCGHAPTAGTCAHLLGRFEHLWTFATEEGVEPTNNAAERALRHAVIWRKLSFGSQSDAGSRFVERTLSVVETCRQQHRSPLEFVLQSVQAHFRRQPGPSLLSEA